MAGLLVPKAVQTCSETRKLIVDESDWPADKKVVEPYGGRLYGR